MFYATFCCCLLFRYKSNWTIVDNAEKSTRPLSVAPKWSFLQAEFTTASAANVLCIENNLLCTQVHRILKTCFRIQYGNESSLHIKVSFSGIHIIYPLARATLSHQERVRSFEYDGLGDTYANYSAPSFRWEIMSRHSGRFDSTLWFCLDEVVVAVLKCLCKAALSVGRQIKNRGLGRAHSLENVYHKR